MENTPTAIDRSEIESEQELLITSSELKEQFNEIQARWELEKSTLYERIAQLEGERDYLVTSRRAFEQFCVSVGRISAQSEFETEKLETETKLETERLRAETEKLRAEANLELKRTALEMCKGDSATFMELCKLFMTTHDET